MARLVPVGWIALVFLFVGGHALSAAPSIPDARPVFTMAFGFDPSDEPAYRYFERLYEDALGQLGYRFAYEVYPLARCTVLAEEGVVDGEPQRIRDYQAAHPNLVRVEANILTNRTLAFGRASVPTVSRWSDLTRVSGAVVYLIGAIRTRDTLTSLLDPARLLAVSTVEQGLELVRTGRADVFVDIESRARVVFSSPRFASSDLRVIGVVEVADSFPYVHKSHAALAGRLAQVLNQMRADGRMDRYLHDAIPGLSVDGKGQEMTREDKLD